MCGLVPEVMLIELIQICAESGLMVRSRRKCLILTILKSRYRLYSFEDMLSAMSPCADVLILSAFVSV